MRSVHCLYVACLIAPLFAFAHLGDTEQQLVARFGRPLSRGRDLMITQGKIIEFGSKLSFRQGDWAIECIVIDSRCTRAIYSKPGEWSEEQLSAVLTSNAQGAIWTDYSKEMTKKLARDWRRSDGAVATWRMGVNMTVTNPAYDREKQKIESKAKADASMVPNL
jgi:hypothetical protein